MSISSSGVKISKRKKGTIILALFTIIELVFSVLLVVSLASNLLFPQRASAVAGVSAKLSYQGRLTDLSGNPLGGSGTNYCFRFSIFDAASGGTKQWPAGAPNSTTVKVEDGVFNTDIGTADSLATFDFSSVDTLYLNVEVNATPTTCGGSWEQLDLRQRIDSVGYARAAEGVYSSLLRAPTGGTAVQIGTGAGAATPIFLNLDIQNTDGGAIDSSCSTSGQIWYNSFDSKARICQGSVIRDLIDGILVKDEGTNIGRASVAINFTGTAVTATKGSEGVIDIDISASGGGVMTYLGGTTLGANSATISVSLSTAKEHINCYLESKGGSASGISQVRFNGDAGAASYGWNQTHIITTAIADIQDASDDAIQLTGTAADTDPTSSALKITNFSDTNKTVIYDTVTLEPAGTNSDRHHGVGGWYNTADQITSVVFSRSAGNYLAGSHAWCEGRDI